MNNYLLVRNIRSNWSCRLLFEFFTRNLQSSTFSYINLIKFEDFPPYKPSSLFLRSNIIEIFNSHFLYRNSSSKVLINKIRLNNLEYRAKYLSKSFFIVLFKLSLKKNSKEIFQIRYKNVEFGRFFQTVIVSKYGVKWPEFSNLDLLRNLPMVFKFLASYHSIDNILRDKKYSHVVLINGRDVVGVGAQLAAFNNGVEVVCLESGLAKGLSVHQYAEWYGNMHHWRIRQNKLQEIFTPSSPTFTNLESVEFIKNYMFHPKFWSTTKPSRVPKDLLDRNFICFFTTSEKETTTCPTGSVIGNDFDEFDQIRCLKMVHSVAQKLKMPLVIRLHPNFTSSKQAKNEKKYFADLIKNWDDVIMISNDNATNSYELAYSAHTNFTFRSSISAVLSLQDIDVYFTAPSFWSYLCPDKLTLSETEIEKVILNKSSHSGYAIDSQGWANYYLNNGSKFTAFELDYVTGTKGQRLVYSLGTMILDIPKYKFLRTRN